MEKRQDKKRIDRDDGQRSQEDRRDDLRDQEGRLPKGRLPLAVNGSHLSSFHCSWAEVIKHSPFPPLSICHIHLTASIIHCCVLPLTPHVSVVPLFLHISVSALSAVSLCCYHYSSKYPVLFSCPSEIFWRLDTTNNVWVHILWKYIKISYWEKETVQVVYAVQCASR